MIAFPRLTRVSHRLVDPTTPARLRLSSTSAASTKLKPYFVTTPIFYVNADPHIGHLYSDVIGDVLTRYQSYARSGYSRFDHKGLPVSQFDDKLAAVPRTKSFLCTGTDEHGLKIQKVAEAAGQDPQKLCDRISKRFRDLADAANIDYTTFIRTTDPEHKLAVAHLWRTLRDEGHIYKGSHAGWYAVSDEAFYSETQVHEFVVNEQTGEKQMQSLETGAKVEWSSEENYKFRLSAFQEPLLRWLRSDPKAIQPAQKHAEVLQEIENGLADLSISRPSSRLSWGIPVPDDPEHSIYVWVDALTNYITVTGYPWNETAPKSAGAGGSAGMSAWPADVHIVGKDIIRFHTIYWPAFLLAANLPLPKTVLAHSHWTMNKAKMSKSRGNVANPFDAIDTFGLDALRYFLIRIGGNFGSDADYSPAVLLELHRKYLQGQLGNLLSRALAPKIQTRLNTFAKDPESNIIARLPRADVVPHLDEEVVKLVDSLETNLIQLPAKIDTLFESFELAKAMVLIMETVIGQANEVMQRLEPWSPNTPVEVVLEAVVLITETLRISALLLQPVMPHKMSELLDALQIPAHKRLNYSNLIVTDSEGRLASHVMQRDPAAPKIKPLFPKLEVELG